MRYYLAIDIGVSSGRHIVGWQEKGEIKTNEVYRFPNGVREENGHLVWDVRKPIDSKFMERFWSAISIGRGRYAFPSDNEFEYSLSSINVYQSLRSNLDLV